jgi:hypothetical protein
MLSADIGVKKVNAEGPPRFPNIVNHIDVKERKLCRRVRIREPAIGKKKAPPRRAGLAEGSLPGLVADQERHLAIVGIEYDDLILGDHVTIGAQLG